MIYQDPLAPLGAVPLAKGDKDSTQFRHETLARMIRDFLFRIAKQELWAGCPRSLWSPGRDARLIAPG